MSPEKVRVQPVPLLAKTMYEDLVRDHKWDVYKPLKREAGHIENFPPEISALFKYLPPSLLGDSIESSMEAQKRSTHTFVGNFKFYPTSNKNMGIEIRITTFQRKQKNKIYVGTFRRKRIKNPVRETFSTRKVSSEDKAAVENYLQNGLYSLMELFPKESKNVTGGW